MHSGDEPVGLCDTGLHAVVYCLIVFNVQFCYVQFHCFLCSTPPVQSKIASLSSLTLRSQRRSATVAKRQTRRLSFFTQKWLNPACAIKDCFVLFAYAPFTTAVIDSCKTPNSSFVVFHSEMVQFRLCNQRLLRSLRLRSVHNGGGVRFRPVRRSSASPSRAHTPYGT